MVEGHDTDNDCQQGKRDECVREERDGLATEVAERFVLRDVPSVDHRYQISGYLIGGVKKRVSVTSFVAC